MDASLLWTLAGAAFTLSTAYSLGALLMRKRPAPPEILLGIGGAALSFCVFVLLLLHWAYWSAFLAIGAVASPLAWRYRGPATGDPVHIPRPLWIIFGAYGVWYLVNAL